MKLTYESGGVRWYLQGAYKGLVRCHRVTRRLRARVRRCGRALRRGPGSAGPEAETSWERRERENRGRPGHDHPVARDGDAV